MSVLVLKLTPAEVVSLLRAETRAAQGAPELAVAAHKEYLIQEDFDAAALGVDKPENVDFVSSMATLTIEPRVESGYWVLEALVERELGPVEKKAEYGMGPRSLSLDEFEAEVDAADVRSASVRLVTQTPEEKQDFERWLADARERHRHAGREIKEKSMKKDTQNLLVTTALIWLVGAGAWYIGPTLQGEKAPGHETAPGEAPASHTATSAPAAEPAPTKVAAAPAETPAAAPAASSSSDELATLAKDAKQWVSPTGDYANVRHSALTRINADNVGKLQLAWQFSTGVLRGHEGAPLVVGEVCAVTRARRWLWAR